MKQEKSSKPKPIQASPYDSNANLKTGVRSTNNQNIKKK